MGIETDLNVNPYYDDFDENKDFHRVLFKPAVPLQARELTQLQTILQNQIEKFGQFTFKEGSIVKGCSFTYNRDIKFAKILDKDSSGLDINVNLYGEGDFTRNSSNLVARIVDTAGGLQTQNPDLNTLFFNYVNTGNSGNSQATAYEAGLELEVYPAETSISNVVFTGVPSDVFVSNSDTVSVSVGLKGTGFSGNVVTTDNTNVFSSVKVNANGSGFSVDDLPTATIVASNGGIFTQGNSTSNTTYDLANAISNGQITVTVNLNKTGNVTIANSDFVTDSTNSQFNVIGNAFQMKVGDGVIFQKGTFQRFSEQDIIVSKYTSRPNEIAVGVATTESFVNSSADTSLLDNASGFANENAPGADRLKLQPTLVVNTIPNATSSNNFLKLVEFQHGLPVKMNSNAQLSGLGQVIEQRLYEQSGDYVIEPIQLASEEQVGNTTHFSVVVGAGIGYNKGKRFEIVNPTRVSIPKATTSANIVNQEVSINYGNYVVVDELAGTFGHDTNDRVLIMDEAYDAISGANSSTYDLSTGTFTDANTTLTYAGTTGNVVGHARVRAVEQDSADPSKSTSQFNFYLFDIQMSTGKSFAKHAKSIFHYSAGEYTGTLSQTNQTRRGIADLVLENSKAVIKEQDPEDRDLLFSLGQKGIKSISNVASYTFESVSGGEFNGNAVASIAKAGTQRFDFGTSATDLSETQERELLIVSNTTIVSTELEDNSVTIDTSSNVITTVNTTDIFEGDYIRIANTSDLTGANAGIYQVVKKISDGASGSLQLDRNVTGIANTTAASVHIAYPKGRAISLRNRTTANASVSAFNTASPAGQTLTINLGRTLAANMSFDLIHNVRETSTQGILKNYKTSEVAIYTSNNAGGDSGPWTLGIPDAHEMVSVYVSANNTNIVQASNALANSIANGTMIDRTDEFTLSSGQQGSKYGLASISLAEGSTFSVNNATIAVTFRHFGIQDGAGFASFNSYAPIINDALVGSNTTIKTAEIPYITSSISGKEYSLRDVIDFRPYVANTATLEGTFLDADATVNPSNTESISGATKTSTPNKGWISTIEYYLPRKDRLIIEDGSFHVVRGKADVNPELPPKPAAGMQLGTIDIPVYPSLSAFESRVFSRTDLAVKIRTTQLKRYKMSDIKKLDDRLDNLEYYTSLNLLEKQTSDEVLPGRNDATSNRFKNGFIVDNFSNYSTGNPLNSEFKAGFDIARKVLTPRFEQYNIGLKFSSASNGWLTGDTMTLNHQVREIINQPEATQSRRATSAFWQYNGDIQLYPDYLNYVDTQLAPEPQISIDIDHAKQISALIDQFNKLAPMQTPTEEVLETSTSDPISINVEISADGRTKTETFKTITEETIKQTTQGVSVSDITNTQKRVGEYITNIAFQPYIPATNIYFVVTGLRPNLRHYFYFDNSDVNQDVAAAKITNGTSLDDLQTLSTRKSKQQFSRSGSFGASILSDDEGTIVGVFRVPQGAFAVGERKFAVADVSNLSQINETVSAASARFNCFNFSIEKQEIVTNTREAVLSDTLNSKIFTRSSDTVFDVVTVIEQDDGGGGGDEGGGDDGDDGPGSGGGGDDDWRFPICEDLDYADIDQAFWAGNLNNGYPHYGYGYGYHEGWGYYNNRKKAIDCHVCPDIIEWPCDGSGGVKPGFIGNFPTKHYNCGKYMDPLAQSFLVQPEMLDGAPSGYLRQLDLYFAGKHSKLGCIVELREVVNGLPSPKVLPFSRTYLRAGMINTSTTGTVKTTVYFKGMVAVQSGKEYCFVVKPVANNPEIKLFTAKAGQKSLTSGVAINQDWGDGTMFLSSNDRTWTPYADEDVKFTIYAARFKNTTGGVRLVNDDYEFVQADSNGINGTFQGGEEVFINAANTVTNLTFTSGNSSVIAGTGVDFSTIGISAGNKIVLQNANSKYDVVEVGSANSSTITLRGAPDITEATATGGSLIFTPVGTFAQLDANTKTLLVNDSTSTNSTFLYEAGDTLIGCTSSANVVIGSLENTTISYVEPRFYNSVPERTSITSRIAGIPNGANANYHTLSSRKRLKTNDRNYLDTPIEVRSKSNEINGTTITKSLQIDHAMSSTYQYMAPYVDLQSQSLLVYENIVNNDVTNEHLSGKGSALAKYISRTVTLGDGLDAEDIKVFVNAYKPQGTDVKVYAKVLNQADEIEFADGVWSELQKVKNKDKVSSSQNRRDVIEYSYEFKDAPSATIQTGSIAFTNGSPTITGTGTLFDSEFAAGDLVKIDNPPFDANTNYQISMVSSVASNTSLTLADNVAIGTELQGRQISKVDSSDKNQVFRDPQNDTQFIATYYNTNNEKFEGYKYLAIKIVLTSDSKAKTPYCKDFRALAVSL